ncbi:MAG: HK97-gp10 family putative phage morphogenesis protein [Pseudomonadota bacterium]
MKGIAAARRRRARAPDVLREAAADRIRETVTAGRKAGRENIDQMVDRRTGVLKRFYRSSVSAITLTGRFGYISRKGQRAAFYARFLNDGTRHLAPRPFHDNAVDQVEAEHARGMLAAMRRAVRGR